MKVFTAAAGAMCLVISFSDLHHGSAFSLSLGACPRGLGLPSSSTHFRLASAPQGQQEQQRTERRSVHLPPRFEEKVICPLDTPFVIDPMGPPTDEELCNENLMKIVTQHTTDQEVNTLVWKCLGYRCREDGTWDSAEVFPKWQEKYPSPPDFVNITREYSREMDRDVLKAIQTLVRAIPMSYKQSLKEHLKPLGFTGFWVDELTPNRTRRAQATNFIIYYRENLHGRLLGDLQKEREDDLRQFMEGQQQQQQQQQ